MKPRHLSHLAVAVVLMAIASTSTAAGRRATQPSPALAPGETSTLQWMREEEKLARDVYGDLALMWQSRVFTNIQASEQRHFDAMGRMIDLYRVSDPAVPAIGMFKSDELQALYHTLVNAGGVSYLEALKVGALVEEVDILDLDAALAGTTQPALQNSYRNLRDASTTHLRRFVSLLRALGVDYEPQRMDPEDFSALVGPSRDQPRTAVVPDGQ